MGLFHFYMILEYSPKVNNFSALFHSVQFYQSRVILSEIENQLGP